MKALKKIIFLLLIVVCTSHIYGQDANTSSAAPKTKQQKKYTKKKEQQLKNEKKVENELKEAHWKHQTKAVQKRMKKSHKQAEKMDRDKTQTSKWKQWWYRKRRK